MLLLPLLDAVLDGDRVRRLPGERRQVLVHHLEGAVVVCGMVVQWVDARPISRVANLSK